MAVKASKDQNLTNIFSDETLDMYNWTGKGKRSIKTSKVFKIIKSKKIIARIITGEWFKNDLGSMKTFIQVQIKNLSSRNSKLKNKTASKSNDMMQTSIEEGNEENDPLRAEELFIFSEADPNTQFN